MSEKESRTEAVGTGIANNRRRFLQTVGAGSVVAAAGCTLLGAGDDVALEDRDKIRIGVMAAEEMPTGQSIISSAEMAAEDINSNGGIAGADVKIKVADSQMDPNQAVTGYRNLVDRQNIDLLSGIWISEVGMTLAEEIADDSIPTMVTAMGTPDMHDLLREDYGRYKYLFRNQFNTFQMAGWSKDYIQANLIDDMGAERFGLIIEDALWSEPYGDELEAFFENNDDAELAFTERPATDVSDFSPILRDADNQDLDVVYTIFSHLPGTTFFEPWQLNEYNFLVDGFIATGMQFSYWQATEGQCEYLNTKMQQGFSQEVPQKMQEYVDRNGDSAAGPHWQSYDAIYLLKEAVEAAESLDEDDIVDELLGLSYEGVGGITEFYGEDGEYPHNMKSGPDYVYPRATQWQELEEDNPISGGGIARTVWPAYDEFALVDDANAIEGEGLPFVERGEYEIPPWVDM